MTKQRLLVVGPLPPPFHGVTVSTSLVLENPLLAKKFRVEHLNTSDHRSAENVGSWDATNVLLGVTHLSRLVRKLRGERGTLYLPLSQSSAAVLRDLLFINVAQIAGWRVAAHLRGGEFRDFYSARNPVLRAWMRATLRRLDGVAVMGSTLRSLFSGLVPDDRIEVVANGTPDCFRGEHTRERCVLFLSNLRRRKGIVEAVEAAVLVAASDTDAHFEFVGEWEDARLEAELKARAGAFSEQIQFIDAVRWDERNAWLDRASVFLFPPTEPEGHPRVVLEALSAGLPIVTTDRGAIAETVVDGVTGFVLPEPRPVDIAAKVRDLLRDEELRARMARAARDDYLRRFTQEAADRKLANWLDRVSQRTSRAVE